MLLDYNKYYKCYLGINESEDNDNIFACSFRNQPIYYSFFQPLIVTKLKDKIIFSIAPQYYIEFVKLIDGSNLSEINENLINQVEDYFSNVDKSCNIRKMYRMSVDKSNFKHSNKEELVTQINLSHKNIFFNSIKKEDNDYKEKQWSKKKELINDGRTFAIIDEEKIVASAEISNIYCNGGNIVVWTKELFRNRGFAKTVVLEAINWCFDNNIIPIYWVDSLNVPSLNLAKSLGLQIYSEELVVSTQG